MGTKLTAARKKQRQPSPTEGLVDYIMAIQDWDWNYWLALNTLRDPLDPWQERPHLQIKGQLSRPTGLNTDQAVVWLFPTTSLNEERRKDFKPIALGSLESRAEKIDGYISIPWDALSPVLQMLIAGKLKFLVMRGARFRYRSARLISLRLVMNLTEDDIPDLN